MNNVYKLNRQFGYDYQLYFERLDIGIVVAKIDTPLATATICLYGGQVIDWRPKKQDIPVLWASNLATFTLGKAIRGGLPICWPWFGSHQTNSQLPGHGYARISPWDVSATEITNEGAIRITLRMQDTDMSLAHFSSSVRLAVQITVGRELTVELTTTNESNQVIVLTEGLHTYFRVGDVSRINISGLDGVEYVDLLSNNIRRIQEGPIRFYNELGRIYMNTTAACVIEDPLLNRRIIIEKNGSLCTAVWNPWASTAAKIVDLGGEDWRTMVCLEGANAFENAVIVAVGSNHTHTATYSLEE
jgi:glucose-6-phosphate 1-epimerase